MTRRQSTWKWAVVGVIGFAAWLIPLATTLFRLRSRDAKENKPAPLPASATQPIILYTEGWPTRARINLDEIQGVAEVSAGTLAPQTIASDLQRELAELGIATEPQRLEKLPADFDPGRYRPIILIYPVRHRQLAPEVIAFIDKRIEPWIGRHSKGESLALTDIAISENAGDSHGAQETLNSASLYYKVAYRPGPELYEATTWTRQEELVRAQAQIIRQSLAP